MSASTSAALPNNRLREIRFGEATNALIDVRDTRGAAGSFSTPLPDRPQQLSFTVRRQQSTQATTVPLVAIDDCGEWVTLVGGGPGAF